MKAARSLFGRLALTQFLLVLVFQALGMSVANSLIVLPLVRASARDLAGLAEVTAQAWSRQSSAQRAAFAARLQRAEQLTVTAADTRLASAPGLLPYGRALETELRQRFGDDAHVRLESSGEPTYVLDLPLQGERLRIAFAQRRIGTAPYLAVTLSFGAGAVLSLIAAITLARRLTRPLRDLALAARAVGAGLQPQLPDTHNVAELDLLTQNFNRMVEEVHTLLVNRTTLLAGVSHDLRSPIARLRMALELAAPRLSAEQYAAMERYLEQMNQLIAEYLDFAQGAAQRGPQRLALGPVLAQVCGEHDADPPVRAGDTDLAVLADPLSLQRVLGNLLGNAMRYGVGPVEISVERAGPNAIIDIADRGPGIPADQRERVFEPFVRLESSRNDKTGGAGLGLAIVREICRSHGWQVSLEENAAYGTTARLVLPCA